MKCFGEYTQDRLCDLCKTVRGSEYYKGCSNKYEALKDAEAQEYERRQNENEVARKMRRGLTFCPFKARWKNHGMTCQRLDPLSAKTPCTPMPECLGYAEGYYLDKEARKL